MRVSLLLSLLVAVPGWASGKPGSHAIVLASPEKRSEAEALLAELSRRPPRGVTLREGYPRIVDSASVAGLRPGYHVVLAGYCASSKVAKTVIELTRVRVPQAYFKKVALSIDACPTPNLVKSELGPKGRTMEEGFPIELLPTVRLEAVRGNPGQAMECETYDFALQLWSGATLAGELLFPGACQGACTPEKKKEGAEELRALKEAVARGDAYESELHYGFTGCRTYTAGLARKLEGLGPPMLLVQVDIPWPHDVVMQAHRLVAFIPECGGLVMSEQIGPVLDVENLTARAIDPKAPASHFVFEVDGKPELEFRLDRDTCKYVMTRGG